MVREGLPVGSIAVCAISGQASSQSDRSSCSRPSRTRPSSPSRTSASSRSSRSATAISPRRSSSRPPPARSCGSSRAPRPTSSRCSTRSPRARRGCARLAMPSSRASTATGPPRRRPRHRARGRRRPPAAFPMRPVPPAARRVPSGPAPPSTSLTSSRRSEDFPDRVQRHCAAQASARCSASRCCAKATPSAPSRSAGPRRACSATRRSSCSQTFADQAVIAIENVRLFKELETTQPRPHRDARAADRDQRGPAGHQPLADRSPASAPSTSSRTRRACASADWRHDLPIRRRAPAAGAAYNMPAELRTLVEQYPLPPGRGDRGRTVAHRRSASSTSPTCWPIPSYEPTRHARHRRLPHAPRSPDASDGVADRRVLGRTERDVMPFTDRQVELLDDLRRPGASSPSRTSGSSRSWRPATATSPRPSSSRRRPARSCGSSPPRRPTCSRYSTPSPGTRRGSARRSSASSTGYDGRLLHFVAHHGVTRGGSGDGPPPLSRAAQPRQRGGAGGARPATSSRSRMSTRTRTSRSPPPRRWPATGARSASRCCATVSPSARSPWHAPRPGSFPDRQVDLLKTFADQAVIAIENVRLFQELEARTQDLTRSVGELRALGEVSQAVSSTLDLDTVLATIVARAVELSGSYSGIIYEFDESTQTFGARASHNLTPEYLAVAPGLTDSPRRGRHGTRRGSPRARRGLGRPGRGPGGRTAGAEPSSPSKACDRSSRCRSYGKTSCWVASSCSGASWGGSPPGSSRRSRRSPPSRCWPSTTPRCSVRSSARSSTRTPSCRRARSRS